MLRPSRLPSLTLGVGQSRRLFSFVDAVLLRGLPFEESDRLVAVGECHLHDGSPVVEPRCAAELFLIGGIDRTSSQALPPLRMRRSL